MQKAKERRQLQQQQEKAKKETPTEKSAVSSAAGGSQKAKKESSALSNGGVVSGAPPPDHGLVDPMFNYAVSASEPRQDDMLSEYYLRATEVSFTWRDCLFVFVNWTFLVGLSEELLLEVVRKLDDKNLPPDHDESSPLSSYKRFIQVNATGLLPVPNEQIKKKT